MARRASVDGQVLLLRHMRRHPPAADGLDTVLGVVAAVGPQRARAVAPFPHPVQEFRHCIPLRRAGG